jgi:hypothetical protein
MMVVQHIFKLNEETGSKLTYIIYRFYSWFISLFYGASLMRFFRVSLFTKIQNEWITFTTPNL